MMKKILFSTVALALCVGAMAAEPAKDSFKSHITWGGFIRNYLTFDTRESVSSIEDFFYYLPKDRNVVGGVDINEQTNMTYAAITSRIFFDVAGYEIKGMKVGAHWEADFYAGVSGVTGVATLRLRQAFLTLSKNRWALKAGQAWHPFAIDMPDVVSLNTGSPFNPFSRTPQVDYTFKFADKWSIEAAAIWQMQYNSNGPAGTSADYIKYSCTPEVFLGFNYKTPDFYARIGGDMLSIKPRHNNGRVKVSDRITTISPFVYAMYKKGSVKIQGKAVFAEAGEHMNLNGGYGKCSVLSDGSFTYTPTRNFSAWADILFGKKLQGMFFAGYAKNFGTKENLFESNECPGFASVSDLYFSKNSFSNLNSMFRVTPSVIYNFGPKLSIALEYEVTGAQYGDYKVLDGKNYIALNGLCEDNLHWIVNNRLLGMIRYKF